MSGSMNSSGLVRALPTACAIAVPEAALEPWPLEPDTVIEGEPAAEGFTLSRSKDRRIVRGIWACSPGAFRWVWTYDETVFVLAGRAVVELEHGVVELNAGDLASFERGQASVWRIETPFRKAFHATSSEPLPF